MDLYGKLVNKVLFPAFETVVRKRPTVRYSRYLEQTQWLSLDELRAIQAGELRRLLRHAYDTTAYYRRVMDERGLTPRDIAGPEELWKLPVLDRAAITDPAQRTSSAPPPAAVKKKTGGTTGEPLVFAYNADSRYWRDATRLRAYAWAGYEVGARSLHYWGRMTIEPPRAHKIKMTIDRGLKREHYVDCGARDDAHYQSVVEEIRRKRPEVIVCFTQAGADLARYVVRTGQRDWGTIPVLCGAERVFDHDREVLQQAFGPAVFETYGCREVMLIGSECEHHDGLHTSMENLIVELVVRDGGEERPAKPGEVGDVVLTDLHNLHMPFIRYANGDRAMARKPERCACGRWLERIGPIDGRVSETLIDGRGRRVTGLLFNVLFTELAETTRQFQVVQHVDRSITLKIVPSDQMTDGTLAHLRKAFAKYLPDVPIDTALVDDIPVTAAGKRKLVVVEKAC